MKKKRVTATAIIAVAMLFIVVGGCDRDAGKKPAGNNVPAINATDTDPAGHAMPDPELEAILNRPIVQDVPIPLENQSAFNERERRQIDAIQQQNQQRMWNDGQNRAAREAPRQMQHVTQEDPPRQGGGGQGGGGRGGGGRGGGGRGGGGRGGGGQGGRR